jgi:nucleoid-associated protein YgaU
MALYDGSRYAGAAVLRVPGRDGKARPTLYSMIAPVEYGLQYQRYVVGAGEDYTDIATRLYDDPTQWWRIADVNPQYLYPDFLPTGAVIRLPL